MWCKGNSNSTAELSLPFLSLLLTQSNLCAKHLHNTRNDGTGLLEFKMDLICGINSRLMILTSLPDMQCLRMNSMMNWNVRSVQLILALVTPSLRYFWNWQSPYELRLNGIICLCIIYYLSISFCVLSKVLWPYHGRWLQWLQIIIQLFYRKNTLSKATFLGWHSGPSSDLTQNLVPHEYFCDRQKHWYLFL